MEEFVLLKFQKEVSLGYPYLLNGCAKVLYLDNYPSILFCIFSHFCSLYIFFNAHT
jgi:hypothetical protein